MEKVTKTDGVTGIPNAVIRVYLDTKLIRETLTTYLGDYRVVVLLGSYTLEVEARRYKIEKQGVSLSSGTATIANLQLSFITAPPKPVADLIALHHLVTLELHLNRFYLLHRRLNITVSIS